MEQLACCPRLFGALRELLDAGVDGGEKSGRVEVFTQRHAGHVHLEVLVLVQVRIADDLRDVRAGLGGRLHVEQQRLRGDRLRLLQPLADLLEHVKTVVQALQQACAVHPRELRDAQVPHRLEDRVQRWVQINGACPPTRPRILRCEQSHCTAPLQHHQASTKQPSKRTTGIMQVCGRRTRVEQGLDGNERDGGALVHFGVHQLERGHALVEREGLVVNHPVLPLQVLACVVAQLRRRTTHAPVSGPQQQTQRCRRFPSISERKTATGMQPRQAVGKAVQGSVPG